MAPKRIQRRRTKGWRMPEGAVYVGRPTLWGNLFVADDPRLAVEAYRRLISGDEQSFDMGPGKLRFARDAHRLATHWNYATFVCETFGGLRGHDLACWCPILDQQNNYVPCHADVLLSLANDIPIDEVIHENTRRAKGEAL